MKAKWLALAIAVCACSESYAISGKAAVVVHKSAAQTTSRLLLVTVTGNSISTDTVYKVPDGTTMCYPSFNLDGTQIAFWKTGAGLCVINLADKSVRTVAQTRDQNSNDEAENEWPGSDGGKWIYYHRPCAGCHSNGSGEIWRVNVGDTTKKEMVCDYKKIDSQSILKRWALSADGRYAVGSACCSVWGEPYDPSASIIHLFPPKFDSGKNWWNPTLTAPSICCNFGSECNWGISASGKILFSFSGAHNALYSITWDHAAMTTASGNPRTLFRLFSELETWENTNANLGESFVYPRYSCNSDKVVTIITQWDLSSGVGNPGNLDVVNWKDGQAVRVTNNPDPTVSGYSLPYRWTMDPGDFWVSGGPANSYENLDGSWTAVNAEVEAIRGIDKPRFAVPAKPHRPGAIYNLKGSRIAAEYSQGGALRLRQGAYITGGRMTLVTRN